MYYVKSLWIKIKRKFLRPIKNFILLPGKYKFGDFMEEGYEERLIPEHVQNVILCGRILKKLWNCRIYAMRYIIARHGNLLS